MDAFIGFATLGLIGLIIYYIMSKFKSSNTDDQDGFDSDFENDHDEETCDDHDHDFDTDFDSFDDD